VGVTLSEGQAELANERIREAGLADRCRVEVRDYREVNEPGGFDKVVSVEMFEAVGEEMLPLYFRRAWELLRPGGLFLNQGIALSPAQPKLPRANFGVRYVFPDGALVTLTEALAVAERAGLEARDVENIREHYVLTLRHWVSRLEAQAGRARQITDDVTYRIWRLYMSISAFGFKIGRLANYQVLFSKADSAGESGLPLTRGET
jgi:cyclopropane-fatty-acyl-phospholipid synthase